jgi:hypothetical protein
VLLRVSVCGALGGIRSAEEAGEVTAFFPSACADLVNTHVLHGKIASFEIDKQRSCGIKGAQERGLTNARGSSDKDLRPSYLCQALICCDNFQHE